MPEKSGQARVVSKVGPLLVVYRHAPVITNPATRPCGRDEFQSRDLAGLMIEARDSGSATSPQHKAGRSQWRIALRASALRRFRSG